jgi:hypothetical protein
MSGLADDGFLKQGGERSRGSNRANRFSAPAMAYPNAPYLTHSALFKEEDGNDLKSSGGRLLLHANQQLNYTGVGRFLKTGPLSSISPAFLFCESLQKLRPVLYHSTSHNIHTAGEKRVREISRCRADD